MFDILIQEQGSGGEIIVRNNDVAAVYGYENQPYLAHFGGTEWILNELLFADTPDQQFTAKTETLLNTIHLSSGTLLQIERTMGEDLQYLIDSDPTFTSEVTARITGVNRLEADITLNGVTFVANWHPDSSFLDYKIG